MAFYFAAVFWCKLHDGCSTGLRCPILRPVLRRKHLVSEGKMRKNSFGARHVSRSNSSGEAAAVGARAVSCGVFFLGSRPDEKQTI